MKELFKHKYDELFNPVLKALQNLGGSGSVDEIEDEVASILNLTEKQLNEIHRGNTTKLSYRLAWARNYLKRFGLLENSSRGVWSLTPQGLKIQSVDKEVVKNSVKRLDLTENNKHFSKDTHVESGSTENLQLTIESEELIDFGWKEQLITRILKLSSAGFERLCQRFLRELGFQNVEVTGKSNDGGIDGKGMLRLGGVLSFHVSFQAKKHKGTISPSTIRDFRGAMMGRADKGLVITTGTFTKEAKREASRDGATPIDLIDGNDLCEKLKELRLGVEIELIEKVTIQNNWFDNF